MERPIYECWMGKNKLISILPSVWISVLSYQRFDDVGKSQAKADDRDSSVRKTSLCLDNSTNGLLYHNSTELDLNCFYRSGRVSSTSKRTRTNLVFPPTIETVISEGAPAVIGKAFTSSIIPLPDPTRAILQALEHSCWIEAMQEEIHEFGTFRCLDTGDVLKNKARLVAERISVRKLDLQKAWSDPSLFREKQHTSSTGYKIYMLMMDNVILFRITSFLKIPEASLSTQSKYAQEILKKFGFDSCTPIDTPMAERPNLDEDKGGKLIDPTRFRGTIHMGLWYPKDSGFELKAFADADYAGCHDTRRSTSGSAQFLGHRLVSWSSKKQKSTAISTTEAEYIALSGCTMIKSLDALLNYETIWIAFIKF
ncbi:hypothetical protein Tco_0930545 [Tanacetum coccineum]